jgi:sugar phosphate isomerase/epimerase
MNTIALAPTSLPNTPPLEYVDAAARAGYEAVGIRLYRSPGLQYGFFPVAGDAELTRKVKDAIAAAGLEVYDILSFYMQPEMDLESMKPPLELGAELGAKYALVIGDDPDWGRMVQNFARFCEVAGSLGMGAAIEAPVVSRQVNTLHLAARLIAESGTSNGAISIDPWQFTRAGHTPATIKEFDAALFPYTQINDGSPDRGGFCMVGEGEAPLAGMLDALPAGLPLSLECPAPRGSDYAPPDWAKIALEGTQRFLAGYYAARP